MSISSPLRPADSGVRSGPPRQGGDPPVRLPPGPGPGRERSGSALPGQGTWRSLPCPRSAPVLTTDLAAVRENVRTVLSHTDAAVMAVVKADGYGGGAVETAWAALAAGATWLGVTSIEEALTLRAAGLTGVPVLSWLNPVHADFAAAVGAGVDLAVPSRQHLRAVGSAASPGEPARVHLFLDTGMARDGADPDEWPGLCRAARVEQDLGRIRVVGVMGHLPCADTPGSVRDTAALALFERGVRQATDAGLRPEHRHLAATAATLTDRRSQHTMCRIGAGLVGIDPSGTVPLRQAMSLTAPLVLVREVAPGTPVGYGSTWQAPRATRLGLVALGYADGIPRQASGRAAVLVGGRRRPVVGAVSMDQFVVDLGSHDPVAPADADGAGGRETPGATVVVFGPGDDGEPTVQDWARWCGTIAHEIITGLGPRVVRAVVDDGQGGE